nr:hypothetical protein [uncultured Fretibacterium sp.]
MARYFIPDGILKKPRLKSSGIGHSVIRGSQDFPMPTSFTSQMARTSKHMELLVEYRQE